MKAFLFILLLALTAQAGSLVDRYYPEERYHPPLHIGISGASTAVSYYGLELIEPNLNPWVHLTSSIAIGLLPGISKELYDEYGPNGGYFSWNDMMSNSMGSAIGLSLVLFFDSPF